MSKGKILSLSVVFLVVTIFAGLYLFYQTEPIARYEETDNTQLKAIRQNLTALKKQLRKEGKYMCCIKNDCNWCALHMGHCPCANLVRQKGKEKSCPDCAAAWNKKQGRFPGVNADAIEVTTFGIYGYEQGGHHYESKKSHGDH